MILKVVAEHKDLIPTRGSADAAGLDLRSNIDTVIQPGRKETIPCGLKIEIDPGYVGDVRSRSGLAAKNNIFVLNSPGTIDADYRGEVKVMLMNLGHEPFTVRRLDRIAQLVILALPTVELVIVEALTESQRGEGGFGSTGK